MDSYTSVLRGIALRKRLEPTTLGRVYMQAAVDEAGAYRPCAVCMRDVCDIMILRSDAHRAAATKNCMQCGCICCVECVAGGDSVPDFNK